MISEAFANFGYKPRPKQKEIINNILELYIDKNIKNVVVSAGTGLGKSLIALITTECLSKLKKNNKNKLAYVIAHTNTLLEQYVNSYSNEFDIVKVMGKSQYSCQAMNSTAEDCFSKSAMKKDSFKHLLGACKNCEYMKIKQSMKTKDYFLTNYSYFFTCNLTVDNLDERLITVYDEAHLLNDQFVNHMKIELNSNMISKYKKEVETCGLMGSMILLEQIEEKFQHITETNYEDFLTSLSETYVLIIKGLQELIDDILKSLKNLID
jgi:Rad3-related DNA helicase